MDSYGDGWEPIPQDHGWEPIAGGWEPLVTPKKPKLPPGAFDEAGRYVLDRGRATPEPLTYTDETGTHPIAERPLRYEIPPLKKLGGAVEEGVRQVAKYLPLGATGPVSERLPGATEFAAKLAGGLVPKTPVDLALVLSPIAEARVARIAAGLEREASAAARAAAATKDATAAAEAAALAREAAVAAARTRDVSQAVHGGAAGLMAPMTAQGAAEVADSGGDRKSVV